MTAAGQSTGVAVVVCGMPDSCNRLIQRLLQKHGIEVGIHHYGTFASVVQHWQRDGLTVAAIWPIRDEDVHRQAIAANGMLAAPYEADYDRAALAHYTRTVRLLAELRVPLLPVHVSQIVKNPNGMGRMMLGWLGQPFQGWADEVIDPDRKWREGIEETEREARIRKATLAGDPSKEIIGSMSARLRGRASMALGRIARPLSGAQHGTEDMADEFGSSDP